MPKMQLFGGEKDGWYDTFSADSIPEVFYAVPNLDEDQIKKARGTAKGELRDRLAVLAYKYDPDRSNVNHYKMYRAEELDKVRH